MLRERLQLLYLQGFIFIGCLKVCLPQLIEGKESTPWKVEHPKKTSAEIIAELKKHKIIPEIIEQTPSDVSVCEVSYNDTVVNFGNIINYTFIQEHEPTHIKWPHKENTLYTLIFTSPDTPGMKEYNERELILWLVGNIPENNVKNGTSIVDYVGMFPYYEEGLHRYIYFVYEQKDAKQVDFSNEIFIPSHHLRECLSLLDESKKSNSWKVEYPKKTSPEIIAELNTHQIIPEIVKEVSTNVSVCEVSYDDTVVNFGNIINYTYIQAHAPTHVKWPFEKGILYTLIMTSPDAPAREYHKEREVIMWLVGNIPENDIENGTSIADYLGMVPFYVEGLHRYIYFVYEQEDAGEIDFLYDEVFLTSKEPVLLRAYHHSEEFRQTHELGSIVATNFFYMNYEK